MGNAFALYLISFELADVCPSISPDVFSCPVELIFYEFAMILVSVAKRHNPIAMALFLQQRSVVLSSWPM